MKLYDYSRRRSKSKDIQFDQLDEEIRRIWDALYNRRGQYSDQFGGAGNDPFTNIYGVGRVGGPGYSREEILARIPRGTSTTLPFDPLTGLPSTPSFVKQQFSIHPPGPYPVTVGASIPAPSGIPIGYVGRTFGYYIPTVGAEDLVDIKLKGPNITDTDIETISPPQIVGGASELAVRYNTLLDEEEYIQVTVNKTASDVHFPPAQTYSGHFTLLLIAKWPLGQTDTLNLGYGINLKFIRVKVAPTSTLGTPIYTSPANKVSYIPLEYVALRFTGAVSGSPTAKWRHIPVDTAVPTVAFPGLYLWNLGSRYMNTPFQSPFAASSSSIGSSGFPLLEPGDQFLVTPPSTTAGTFIIAHFPVYEIDLTETLNF